VNQLGRAPAVFAPLSNYQLGCMFNRIETLVNDLRQARPVGVAAAFRPKRFGSTAVGSAIIQLAAGRAPEGLALTDSDVTSLKPAAQQYVVEVMLSASSDYLCTLGIGAEFGPAELRDNYRRLMSLVHPDARPEGFPLDAASRVNKAYDVLSNETSRIAYLDRFNGMNRPVVLPSMVPTPFASRQAPESTAPKRPTGRVAALVARFVGYLGAAKPRALLLWGAAILLLPALLLIFALSGSDKGLQLVEARPKLVMDNNALSEASATPVASTIALATSVEGDQAQSVTNVNVIGSGRDNPTEPPATTTTNRTENAQVPLKSSGDMSRGSPPPTPATSIPTPQRAYTTLAPERGSKVAALDAVTDDLRPSLSTQPASAANPQSVSTPATSSGSSGGASAGPANGSMKAPDFAGGVIAVKLEGDNRSQDALNRDLDDLMVRFSSAYETGSLSSLQQLMSPSMLGRGQTLAEYERLFQASQSRRIRFAQLKYVTTGGRLSSIGPATVVVSYPDKRVVTQKIYLEIDFVRNKGGVLIERVANYVIE